METAMIPCAELPPHPLIPAGFWGDAIQPAEAADPWVLDGYLAPGRVTLLTSMWKSGKTTLVSVLLDRMRGGGALAGLPVAPGKALVISEEPRGHWDARLKQFQLGHVYFICQPFLAKPSPEQWQALLDHAADLKDRHDLKLLVVDTLTTFLPGGNEASAGSVMNALLPLAQLTRRGLSVLLLHHPRKAASAPGYAARGSGALAGFADIVVEMSFCPHAAEDDRRRRLLAFSRSQRTPRQLVIELNQAGDDYRSCGDFLADDFAMNWELMRGVLERADQKLTRREILADWPSEAARPEESTLWRWLQRAGALGLVCQEGDGCKKNAPFRYWLPQKGAEWANDPLRQFFEQAERNHEQVLAAMRTGKISGAG
jgi:AAA domain